MPVVLMATIVIAALAAALADKPVWAAVAGSGLVLAYWGLEQFAWRRGAASPTFGGALGVALAGMVLRIAVVLGLLVALALVARDAFPTTLVSFIVAFTLYEVLRLFWYADAAAQVGTRPS